jgi:hypothetical protein
MYVHFCTCRYALDVFRQWFRHRVYSEKKRALYSVLDEYDSMIYRGPGFLAIV